MPLHSPPPIWTAPVTPVTVVRGYRAAPPFAAGGRRSVRLRSTPGATVHAPCAGVVSFAGRVASGAPVLTLSCDGWRATVRGLAPAALRGAGVAQGDVIGRALGAQLGLSARTPGGSYRDPIPLLRRIAEAPLPPALARRAPRPVRLQPAKGLTTTQAAAPAPAPAPADLPLGITGIGVGLGGLLLALGHRWRGRSERRAPTPVHHITSRR